jgi:transcription initiation factor IIE alpha subunit
MYKDDTLSDGHNAIKNKVCPSCNTPIRASRRYGNIVKKRIELIEKVKMATRKESQKIEEMKKRKEKAEIIAAMAKELGQMSKGHWFYCPNGHPYVIGECGGAMQVSKCPDCGARVGGAHHKLIETNQKADNFLKDV